MSKIGKQPVLIPAGVTVEVSGHNVKVTGSKGVMERHFPAEISVEVKEGKVLVSTKGSGKYVMSIFGTIRALINNDVKGVSEGWSKKIGIGRNWV